MTMKADLMARLLKQWVTPADAFLNCNCLSLSQRCGEWRMQRELWEFFDGNQDAVTFKKPPLIIDKWVTLAYGKRVKAYRAIK
jgi:hypothetical protein